MAKLFYNFGMVIIALKKGKCVAREGWNKDGMFVFKQNSARIPVNGIMNMQSVPLDAKVILIERASSIKYTNQMALIQPDGRIDSWVPSSSDVFAEDWYIL